MDAGQLDNASCHTKTDGEIESRQTDKTRTDREKGSRQQDTAQRQTEEGDSSGACNARSNWKQKRGSGL